MEAIEKNQTLSVQKKLNSIKSQCKKIIFYSEGETNYYLCFAALNNYDKYYVQKVYPTGSFYDIYSLLDADLVIFNRSLEPYLNIIDVLVYLGIPCYYYIDDNFIIIEKEYQLSPWYTRENMIAVLQKMQGVLVSSLPLKAFFEEEKLHSNITYYPPAYNEALSPILPLENLPLAQKTHCAIIGGNFRQASFNEDIIPALIEFNKKIPLKLFLRKGLLKAKKDFPIEVEEFEFETDYNKFIHQLNVMRINILIHPFGLTKNAVYKTNSILMTATYINANILVFDEPAFKNLDEKDGVRIRMKPNSDSHRS